MSANSNKIREDYKRLLSKKTKLSQIELDDLEIGVFNASLDYATENKIQLSWQCQQFVEIYTNIGRCIYSNLVSNTYINNKNLYSRLKKKEFMPHELAYMKREELFPEKWHLIIEKEKLKLKEAYEIKQVSMSDLIKCGKCKNNKVSYQELQTRSGDESMTIFFTCIVCGHKWKT
jgi:DNA-directed RNA polymerase subunit M/transcription elongation factor TFIIS